MAKVLDVIH
jgi:hypothetical protein